MNCQFTNETATPSKHVTNFTTIDRSPKQCYVNLYSCEIVFMGTRQSIDWSGSVYTKSKLCFWLEEPVSFFTEGCAEECAMVSSHLNACIDTIVLLDKYSQHGLNIKIVTPHRDLSSAQYQLRIKQSCVSKQSYLQLKYISAAQYRVLNKGGFSPALVVLIFHIVWFGVLLHAECKECKTISPNCFTFSLLV